MLPSLFQTSIIKRSIMKLVALALAVLLYLQAADCRAGLWQADAPNNYEKIRAEVVDRLTHLKTSALTVINSLDDAEFKDYKTQLTAGVTSIESYIKSTSDSLATFRKGLGPQIVDFILGGYQKVSHDVEELGKKLAPKWKELGEVLKKHLDEYRKLTEPVFTEYAEKNQKLVDDFKIKFQPIAKDLHAKFQINLEETKSKLRPIAETIRDFVTKFIGEMRDTYGAFFQEYKEQIEKQLENLRVKFQNGDLTKLNESLRPKFQEIFKILDDFFTITQ